MKKMALATMAALTALTLIVACDGGTKPDPLYPATVLVTPGEAALGMSTDRVHLTATVKDQNGDPMDGVTVTWSSENTDVATVSSEGVVSPTADGEVKILASVDSVSGSSAITVEFDIQREALVAFYESTNGDDWIHKDNWGTRGPLGDWHGVTADADGNVTMISLNHNDVSGTLPPELGDLEHLESLALGFNDHITGVLPPEIGKLKKLRYLAVHHSELTGTIPDEYAELTDLTSIDFHFNDLHGPLPDWIGDLPNLVVLRLHLLPDMTGRLPRSFMNLDLNVFFWHDSGFCAPADEEFQAWLAAIPNYSHGPNCSS